MNPIAQAILNVNPALNAVIDSQANVLRQTSSVFNLKFGVSDYWQIDQWAVPSTLYPGVSFIEEGQTVPNGSLRSPSARRTIGQTYPGNRHQCRGIFDLPTEVAAGRLQFTFGQPTVEFNLMVSTGFNLVPKDATYDTNGFYSLGFLLKGTDFVWVKYGNDYKLMADSVTTYFDTVTFTTLGPSVNLYGKPGTKVTAILYQATPKGISAVLWWNNALLWTGSALTGMQLPPNLSLNGGEVLLISFSLDASKLNAASGTTPGRFLFEVSSSEETMVTWVWQKPSDYFEFMNVFASAPVPAMSYGFDTGVQPQLLLNPSVLFPYYSWFANPISPPELTNSHLQGLGFYMTKKIVWTLSDGVSVSKGITIMKNYPFYRNPADTMQAEVNNDPSLNNTNPYADLRLTGLPTSFDSTAVNESIIIGEPLIAPPSATLSSLYNQILCPPPLITIDYCLQHFLGAPSPPPGNHWAYPVQCEIFLLDNVSWGDYMKGLYSMLNMVPLKRQTLIESREGTVYFDYRGVSSVYKSMPNLLAPKVYNSGGKFHWKPGFHDNHLVGIELGVDELGGTGFYFYSFDLFAEDGESVVSGQIWPFIWKDGTNYVGLTFTPPGYIGVSSVLTPLVSEGVSNFVDLTDVPDCTTLVFKHNTELTLINGVPGSPVTVYITDTHVNCFCVFPLKSGVIVSCIYTGPVMLAARLYMMQTNFGLGRPDVTFDGFIIAKSRVFIPDNPESFQTDPTLFGLIGTVPLTNVLQFGYSSFDPDVATFYEVVDLTPGEYSFGPSDITCPTGLGQLFFGTKDQVPPL